MPPPREEPMLLRAVLTMVTSSCTTPYPRLMAVRVSSLARVELTRPDSLNCGTGDSARNRRLRTWLTRTQLLRRDGAWLGHPRHDARWSADRRRSVSYTGRGC